MKQFDNLNQSNELDGLKEIKNKIRDIPDFPKKGILFKDITPLLKDPKILKKTVDIFTNHYKDKGIDVVVAAEARGFIFGASLAINLGAGFVPLRKPGKLPYKTIKQEYDLEYGTDCFEIHEDAIKKGERVLIFDDLLATGGTAQAAGTLIEALGGELIGFAFVIELVDLNGRNKLKDYDVFSLIQYDGV